MPSMSHSRPIPPFASLSDAVVARTSPISRFAFLMTMFRDIDDRPFLKQRAHRLERYADLASIDADPAGYR